MTIQCSGQSQRGMALLEGLIAILIFSLGILAIVGIQSASVRNTSDAKYRIDASFLANQVIGEMWVKRSNLADFAVTDEAVSGLPNGKRTIAIDGNDVMVTVTWQPPGDSVVHQYQVATRIQ